ncbi:MAG: hypothetical protein V3R64_01595 [Sphingomonadales bacterium]
MSEKDGPQIFIAVYRPHTGKDAAFRALLKDHGPLLRRLGLITERRAVIMQAKDGSYIEIKEWAAGASAQAAHENAEVAALWDAMGKIADFPGLIGLEEAKEMFAHFKPVEL